MLVKQVIRESDLPLTLLAKDSNLSRAALNTWVSERGNHRIPQPESVHQLAEGLRKRAARLVELADQLDKAA
jgi:hypothetical protein